MSILLQRQCDWCNRPFKTKFQHQKFCQNLCNERQKNSRKWLKKNYPESAFAHRQPRKVKTIYLIRCKNCGEFISSIYSQKLYCDQYCADKLKELNRRARQIKDFKKKNRPAMVAKLFYRDKGICQLCQEPIDLRLEYPSQWSLSIDHVLPVSKGGTNLLSNLQSTHLICNVRRGNKAI